MHLRSREQVLALTRSAHMRHIACYLPSIDHTELNRAGVYNISAETLNIGEQDYYYWPGYNFDDMGVGL